MTAAPLSAPATGTTPPTRREGAPAEAAVPGAGSAFPPAAGGDVPVAELSPTDRSTVRRGAGRARSERADLHAVLDAGLVGHLGVVVDGAPRVLPTGYARVGDVLYVHGSTGARSLREAAGAPVCFTVTLVDGVVYARSAFHHSMNYRCAVVHGTARVVEDADEREAGLAALTEHLAPGSWDATRRPDRRELAATALLALDLTEASVKVRTGPPADDERDLGDGADVWAGVLPLATTWGEPEPCPQVPAGVPTPDRVGARRS